MPMTPEARLSGLVMDVRQGEVICLDRNIRIHVLSKSGRVARVRIEAPLDVSIKKSSTAPQLQPSPKIK
jgi:sRNA-binding carbon storage regulator CsrA